MLRKMVFATCAIIAVIHVAAKISAFAEKARRRELPDNVENDRGAEINGSFAHRTWRREAIRAEVQAIDPPPPVDLPSIFALLLCLPREHSFIPSCFFSFSFSLSLSHCLSLFSQSERLAPNSSTVFHRYTCSIYVHTYTSRGESRDPGQKQ